MILRFCQQARYDARIQNQALVAISHASIILGPTFVTTGGAKSLDDTHRCVGASATGPGTLASLFHAAS